MKMNDTKWAAVDYILNRLCPYLIIVSILFYEFEFLSYQPYAIIALIWFLEKSSFCVGHSVGHYQNDLEYKREVDKEMEKDMEEK